MEKDKLRDAYDVYLEEQGIRTPQPDLSFLEEKRKDRPPLWKRLTKVAVIALAILVTSSGIAVWLNSESAVAAKFGIEKAFYRLSNGIFSTDEEAQVTVEETEMRLSIDDIGKIDKAAEFLPELLYPYYIPEGYTLKTLEITKRKNLAYEIDYNYVGKNEELVSIEIGYLYGGDSTVYVNYRIMEERKLEDRIVYAWENPVVPCDGVSFVLDDRTIQITGDVSLEEKIRIAAEISPYLQK